MKYDTIQFHRQKVSEVLTHIHENLDEKLDLNRLSSIANFAPFHFHVVFRNITGEPLQTFIRRLRLERAVHRLMFTRQLIINIALDAGYESNEAFSRVFKRMFGKSPSRFRKWFAPRAKWPSAVREGPPPCMGPVPGNGFQVKLGMIPKTRLAFTAHPGPYQEKKVAWTNLFHWLCERELDPRTVTALGIVHGNPQLDPDQRVRYEACAILEDQVDLKPEIDTKVLPSQQCLVTPFRGSAELMPFTYVRLLNSWAISTQRRIQPAPHYYERYDRFPSPEERESKAQIFVPLLEWPSTEELARLPSQKRPLAGLARSSAFS